MTPFGLLAAVDPHVVATGPLAIEVGLHEVAGSASLTLVFFPALVLLAVLGIRFGYYAHRNRTATDLSRQTPIWAHLLGVGLLAALYGALGVLEIVSSVTASVKSSVMLAIVLLLALTIRRLYALTAEVGAPTGLERATRVAFGLVVVGLIAGALASVQPQLLATVEGTTALAVLTYGGTFYYAQTSNARLQGTMLDSLLRHLLPVMTFAALVNVTALASGLDLVGANVVPHIQVVFVIMTASTLMTATIKLRQNLAGL